MRDFVFRSAGRPFSRRGLVTGGAAGLATAILAVGRGRADEPTPILRATSVGAGREARAIFDGRSPGPVLRARRGVPFAIAVDNGCGLPFSVHWQGLRLDNRADGAAGLTEAPIADGERRLLRPTPPEAGTFIYRADTDAPEGLSAMVALAGMLIVDGDPVDGVDREFVFAFDPSPIDRRPAAPALPAPLPGTLVDGASLRRDSVRPGDRVLLRIGNVAPASALVLQLDGAPGQVVAIDGQPCPAFPPLEGRIVLPPGGRAEVIALAPPAGADAAIRLRDLRDDGRILVELGSAGAPQPEGRPPLAHRSVNPALPREIPLQRSARPVLVLGGPAGKGRHGPPLATLARGRTVVLAFDNRSAILFGVHIHGFAARLLDALDDGWKPWWHDSLFVPPRTTVRIAFVADRAGRWGVDAMPLGPPPPEIAPQQAWVEVK